MDYANANGHQTTDDQQALTHQGEFIQTRPDTGSHISELPQELLVEVFLIVQATHGLKNWRNVTYVCRHWRLAALNAAVLWTDPPTHLGKYTCLVLERSKSANLHISLGAHTSKATISAVLRHICHIHTMKIYLGIDAMAHAHDILLSCCNIPWPKLTNLEIDLALSVPTVPSVTLPTINLSPSVIRQLTHLQSLLLAHVTFDWMALSCPNLTSLVLDNTTLETTISWEQFLGTLDQMPHLESLSLGLDVILQSSHPPLAQTRCIRLPRLQYLKLDDLYPYSVSYFLSHSILPKLNRLIINIWWGDGNDDHSGIIQTIFLTLANGDFGLLDSILVAQYHIGLYIQGKVPAVDVFLPPNGLYDNHNHIHQFIQGLSVITSETSGALAEVRLELHLNCDELATLLGNLPQLKSLVVHHPSVCSPLAQALKSGTLDSSDTTTLFCALEKVSFPTMQPVYLKSPAMQDFCDSLLARHRSGFGIKTLQFRKCRTIPHDMMKQLEDIGICVVDEYESVLQRLASA
ncbi:hypothetical protein D9619_010101 [Psilocybe cf. subviscida]|uniref:F-box domain-containing protein n=1 Tax=Psilocybe cf. subviscida TaxID=2480587 RepID=A0A8H5F691_9AGAR|nr:hypothetical protein D9619_010101 [Psilocybe cf. subviscida]